MAYRKDLTGKRYGRLTVVKYAGTTINHYGSLWVCKCDCGNTTIVSTNSLRTGNTKSCGCKRVDVTSKITYKHGLCNTRLYRIYFAMLQRCLNPNDSNYIRYGGRGITVSKEWLGDDGFIRFYDWSMEHGYKNDLSIDRIDNDKGYSPDNCRWADRYVQENNRSNNCYVKVNGEVGTVANMARKYNIKYGTLLNYAHGRRKCSDPSLVVEVVG